MLMHTSAMQTGLHLSPLPPVESFITAPAPHCTFKLSLRVLQVPACAFEGAAKLQVGRLGARTRHTMGACAQASVGRRPGAVHAFCMHALEHLLEGDGLPRLLLGCHHAPQLLVALQLRRIHASLRRKWGGVFVYV